MRLGFLTVGLAMLVAACGTGEVEKKTAPTVATPSAKPAGPAKPAPDARRLDSGPVPENESEIARTFERAFVAMPGQGGGQTLATRMGAEPLADYLRAAGAVKFPTVLYLHGCAGLNGLTPLRAMARRGFAVVAPDSFARRFRPRQCDPVSRTGGRNVYVFDFRAAEISYALHRFRRLPWIDKRRLFMVGVSEGGLAVAQYRGDEFRARVITEWTCNGSPLVRGLAAAPDEPVLAVVRADDPWYTRVRGRGQRGDCGAFFGPRPRSRSIVIKKGRRHDVFKDKQAIGAILDFLSEESRRSAYRGS